VKIIFQTYAIVSSSSGAEQRLTRKNKCPPYELVPQNNSIVHKSENILVKK
jgi:hypothetical protein